MTRLFGRLCGNFDTLEFFASSLLVYAVTVGEALSKHAPSAHPWGAWAPPSLAPHSFERASPTVPVRYSTVRP